MASTILSDNGVSSGSAGIKTTADSTGALALQTTTAGGTATTAVTIDTSQNVTLAGTLTIGTATQAIPSGTAPLFAARAWVNFNGTGTVAIRASGNVSSITDNGVGDYTVNFTTAMPDANYMMAGSISGGTGNGYVDVNSSALYLVGSLRVVSRVANTGAAQDSTVVCVSIFR